MNDPIRLNRTGLPPLAFEGALLAEANGRQVGTKDQTRFHNLFVYRTAGGKYVASVRYHSHWNGELAQDTVYVQDTLEALADDMRDHAKVIPDYVAGYPEGDAYAGKQARLLSDILRRYMAQVGEVLAQAGAEERID